MGFFHGISLKFGVAVALWWHLGLSQRILPDGAGDGEAQLPVLAHLGASLSHMYLPALVRQAGLGLWAQDKVGKDGKKNLALRCLGV